MPFEIKDADALILDPHPNGGWTISRWIERSLGPAAKIGAYTCAEDMLDDLTVSLIPDPTRWAEGGSDEAPEA